MVGINNNSRLIAAFLYQILEGKEENANSVCNEWQWINNRSVEVI